jgi:hypothetical protein
MPFRKLDHGWGWLITVAVVAVLAASGFTVVYVNRVVHGLCGIILLQADTTPAPTTERGKQLQKEAAALARKYHCR